MKNVIYGYGNADGPGAAAGNLAYGNASGFGYWSMRKALCGDGRASGYGYDSAYKYVYGVTWGRREASGYGYDIGSVGGHGQCQY